MVSQTFVVGCVGVLLLAMTMVRSAPTDAERQKQILDVAAELFRKGGQAAVDEFSAAKDNDAQKVVVKKYLGSADGSQAWCLGWGFWCNG
ncbi:hypothetical protein BV898_18507 [Hypsibius exemplaris]|uniref:Uncharacterized protein n=1 Tax=Hypsibius exemplaris TaxID=2072580 RepID=A0A9X6NJE7_HYPEX|nr:hypothetical protein BV898_18507 [Hypsibius exemplaris]